MHTYRLLASVALAGLSLVADLTAQEPKPLEIPKDPMAAMKAMPIAEPVADGQTITVIDDVTKKPIAGANVLLFPELTRELQQTSRQMRQQLGDNTDDKVKQLIFGVLFAKRFVTDANGVTKVPEAEQAFAFIVHEDMSKMWHSGLKDPVALKPTRHVTVKVTNSRGKPARDVAVGLAYQDSHFYARAKATTDKTGTCRLEINERITNDKLRIVAMIATDEPVQHDFLASKLTDEPLTLQLPPCGQVRFILYGEDERPAKLLERASLSVKTDGMRRGRSSGIAPTRLEADSALFAYVALDLRLDVAATIKDVQQPISFASKGPTREHEMIVVEGRLKVGPPILRMRVLDQQGKPLANRVVGALKRSEQYYDYLTDQTDADGFLSLSVSDKKPDSIYILLREESEGTSYLGAARIECPNLKPGKQDFGNVQLEEEPVVVKGRLLDTNQQPVAGLWLQGRTTIASNGSGGGSSSGRQWHFNHRVRSDEQGRFELRELHPLDHPIQLSIIDNEWSSADVVLKATADGSEQTFHVSRAGSLSGTLADAYEGMRLDVSATPQEGGKKQTADVRDGKFTFTRVPVGTYDIKFGRRSGFTLKGVNVAKAGEPQDPRLQDINWQEHFQVIETKVTDEQGKPLKNILVWCLEKDGNGWGGGGARTNKDGICRQLAPKKKLQIKVEQVGYVKQVFTEDVANLHIKLKAIAPVKVHIAGLPKMPEGIYANVAQTIGQGFLMGHSPARLKKGRGTIRPNKLGKFQLSLSLSLPYRSDLPANVRNQLFKITRGGHVSFELEATSKPGPVQELTLDEDDVALLTEILDELKEVLKQHKKK